MNKWSSVYGRMGLVFLSASAISVLVFLADSSRAPKKNKEGKSVLRRGNYGSGTQDVALEVEIDGKKSPFTVQIKEQRYKGEELPKQFALAADKLEKLVLGKNKDPGHVRSNLNLVEMIPETGIEVAWQLSNYEVLNLLGELQRDKLPEQGVPVELIATMSYGEASMIHSFAVHLFPPKETGGAKQIRKLMELTQKAESETTQSRYLLLPETVEGEKIKWKYPKDNRFIGLFALGIVGAGGIYLQQLQGEKEKQKKRKQQLTKEYPRLISQLTLFLGAGMSVRSTWFKMVEQYELHKKQKGENAAYEEMCYTMHELQGGVSEAECYERFGSRCKLAPYRKFAVLLSQNLRKGTRGLNELLKREAAEAFEDRKKQARKLGEEAGTKLLGPMFLMLAVVLVIIVVPAFLTIQI